MTMETFLSYLKLPVIAGLFGGIVSLRFFDKLSFWGRVVTVLGGAGIAHFTTPLVSGYFEVAPHNEGGVGFALGLFGMSIAAAAFDAIPAAIRNRLGGGQ
jgi:hypothetical protein